MAKNLRDKGYPSSTKMINPPVKPRVAKKATGKATGGYKKEIPEGTTEYWQSRPRTEVDKLIDDKAEAYANAVNKALKVAKSPLSVEGSTYLYMPDYNWGKRTVASYRADAPGHGRIGFASKEHPFDPGKPNVYSAGIDLADSGDIVAEKEYKLPLGITANVGLDDGTLYGDLAVPQKQYYINALAKLLTNRGK